MLNTAIREAIREAALFQYQVAARLGVTEGTFIRWLHEELSEERRKAITAAIKEERRGKHG